MAHTASLVVNVIMFMAVAKILAVTVGASIEPACLLCLNLVLCD
jgi:hypothetical protein